MAGRAHLDCEAKKVSRHCEHVPTASDLSSLDGLVVGGAIGKGGGGGRGAAAAAKPAGGGGEDDEAAAKFIAWCDRRCSEGRGEGGAGGGGGADAGDTRLGRDDDDGGRGRRDRLSWSRAARGVAVGRSTRDRGETREREPPRATPRRDETRTKRNPPPSSSSSTAPVPRRDCGTVAVRGWSNHSISAHRACVRGVFVVVALMSMWRVLRRTLPAACVVCEPLHRSSRYTSEYGEAPPPELVYKVQAGLI